MNEQSADFPRELSMVTSSHIEKLFSDDRDLHRKVDETRDAYFGFIFPINRDDFKAVSQAFDLDAESQLLLYKKGREFSTFQTSGRQKGQITNHIFGASILALRGKDLDTGLRSVTDENLAEIAMEHEEVILEIAEARSSWFGRIFFPASAFSNAISVFGGNVSPNAVYELASRYKYAAVAGDRMTVRGDFGIGLWLTLLGLAP